MTKKKFSKGELKILIKNKNIQNVSECSITYSDDFKEQFMIEYLAGTTPIIIFENHGFDIDILGIKRVKESAIRWKRLYKKDGILGLKDSRKENSGRPLQKTLTEEGNLSKLKSKIKFLEMENEFLKKLRALRRCVP